MCILIVGVNMFDKITEIKESNTYWVKIFIAGPIEVAKQLIREECLIEGLCVTIDPSLYIYSGEILENLLERSASSFESYFCSFFILVGSFLSY